MMWRSRRCENRGEHRPGIIAPLLREPPNFHPWQDLTCEGVKLWEGRLAPITHHGISATSPQPSQSSPRGGAPTKNTPPPHPDLHRDIESPTETIPPSYPDLHVDIGSPTGFLGMRKPLVISRERGRGVRGAELLPRPLGERGTGLSLLMRPENILGCHSGEGRNPVRLTGHRLSPSGDKRRCDEIQTSFGPDQ